MEITMLTNVPTDLKKKQKNIWHFWHFVGTKKEKKENEIK